MTVVLESLCRVLVAGWLFADACSGWWLLDASHGSCSGLLFQEAVHDDCSGWLYVMSFAEWWFQMIVSDEGGGVVLEWNSPDVSSG